MARGNDARGFALLMVLAGLAVLGLLAAAIGMVAETRLRHAHRLAAAARAEALADAGAHLAVARLVAAAADAMVRPEAEPVRLDLDGGHAEAVAVDEGGRLDVNFADADTWRRLLTASGLSPAEAEALAARILDWADADDLARPSGAEAEAYQRAGLPPPGNRPFAMVAELDRVLGMPPGLAARLAPVLTVHTRLRGFDPAVSRELAALLPEGPFRPSRRRVFAIRSTGRDRDGLEFVRFATVRLTGDPAHPVVVLEWRRAPPGG
ncbi:general secretion pathway protein GspK [Magnetospirillum sp. UT-4]|uniref:general secretion pathway protein GspK n=1 Tax=Magnetospirillum sp. UT-4 TaxID=2681467 RepID=UPI00138102ED|nr:type II secretion system protein GspK [Magnetospirillum sp. UT-4]CAA7621453.1 putative Type II secretion system protein K [Magnetospirillum sp. UT-4]